MSPQEIFKFFFKLGLTGFGGPLALIEEMRLYFVTEKQLLTNPEFNQVYMLIKAMPGPVAFQYAVYLGKKFGGFPGAFLAGSGSPARKRPTASPRKRWRTFAWRL